MNRRTFLHRTATAAPALLSLPAISWASKPRYKLGLQLYTVRDAMAEDPLKTLKYLKELGYEDFEIYGFNPETETIYGMPATELKEALDDLGLSVSSGHYGFSDYFDAPWDQLQGFVDQCILAARQLDSAYITWPKVDASRRNAEDFRRLAEKLNSIGEQVKDAGLGFAYHNFGYEFEDWGGTTGYEILLRDTEPDLVKMEMDMYWVVHSGRSPKELVKMAPGRYVMWHIKDMDKQTRDYTELGNGSIDYTRLLPDPDESGLEYYYLEQGGNFANSSLDSVATSLKYFKKHLQSFL